MWRSGIVLLSCVYLCLCPYAYPHFHNADDGGERLQRAVLFMRIADACTYILLQDKERITLNDRMKLTEPLYDIELETGIQINPYIELMKEWGRRVTPFYNNVTKEGIVLL